MAKATCVICNRQARHMYVNTKYGQPLCREHNIQYNKFGRFFKWNIRSENEFEFFEDRCEIILRSRNMEEVGRVIIDLDDYDKVKGYKWNLNTGYPQSKAFGGCIHTLLMSKELGEYIDHINRNRLDNRKSNLRAVDGSINGINKGKQSNNTSGHVGVSWDKCKKKWEAHIKQNSKKKFLGYFSDISDAVKAREEAELLYYGEVIDRSKEEYTVFKRKNKKSTP